MFKFVKYIVFVIMSFLVKINGKLIYENKSYLFVNTGQIGDLVVSSLILENDDLFKNVCYLLIDGKYSELFSGYYGSIKIISFNKNKYRYNLLFRFRFLKRIRNLNISTTYNITAARGFVNDELTLLSGANEFYATCGSHKYLGSYIGKRFDTKYDEILFPEIKNEYEKTVQLILEISETSEKKVLIRNYKTFNVGKNTLKTDSYITISPFSSNSFRDWGDENYRNIADKISEYTSVVFLCSRNQEKRVRQLTKNLKNVKFIIGPLINIPNIIYNSKLFIGNDSGLTHISYRLGIPVIAILGGGYYGKFFPYKKLNEKSCDYFFKLNCFGCGCNCIYGKPYCITDINKEIVLSKILEILSN